MKPPDAHLRRWGAVYIMLLLTLVTMILHGYLEIQNAYQEAAMHGEEITSAEAFKQWVRLTAENWQSEFMQLFVQSAIVIGAASVLFRKSTEDAEEIKAQLEELKKRLD